MTVPATTLGLEGDGPQSRASADELLILASGDDFVRWEQQLAATGNCANPVRMHGRIDAIDRATGEIATIYDTANEPGGVLRIPCGNRREDICPACSEVYKGDARQIIRSGLTGGKGIPETVTTHPCVFATLTAPGFGPVHTPSAPAAAAAAWPAVPAATHTSAAAPTAATCPAPVITATMTRGWARHCARTATTTPGMSCSTRSPPNCGAGSRSTCPASSPAWPGLPSAGCAARFGSGSSRWPNTNTAASSTTTR
jgi:hypothetical protein